jgi:hypothetical protein
MERADAIGAAESVAKARHLASPEAVEEEREDALAPPRPAEPVDRLRAVAGLRSELVDGGGDDVELNAVALELLPVGRSEERLRGNRYWEPPGRCDTRAHLARLRRLELLDAELLPLVQKMQVGELDRTAHPAQRARELVTALQIDVLEERRKLRGGALGRPRRA